MREGARNINGARMTKNLDIRLRCFSLFLGNRESAEVFNQRNGISALFFRRKLRSCREDALKTGAPVIW